MKMEWGKVAWVATYAKYPLFLYLDLQHYIRWLRPIIHIKIKSQLRNKGKDCFKFNVPHEIVILPTEKEKCKK